MAKTKDPEWVTASELGSAMYCGKAFAFKLRRTPIKRADVLRMKRGTEAHDRKGRAYDMQIRSRSFARTFAAIALVGAIVLLALLLL